MNDSSRRPLTARQQQAADFIAKFTRVRGYPPTTREIAEGLDCNQSLALYHVTALERKGYLRREFYQGRTLVLVDSDELVATIRVHRKADGGFYATAVAGDRTEQFEPFATRDGLLGKVARWLAGDAA